MRGKRFRGEAETFDDDEFDDDEFDDSDELYDPDDDFDEADDEYDEDTDDEFDDDFEAEFDEDTDDEYDDDEYDDDEGGDDEYDDYDDEDGRVQDDDDEDEYYDEDDADREPLLARIRRTGSKVRSNVHVSATTATRIGVAIALLIVGAFVYSVLAAGRRATIVVDNEPTQQAPTSSTAQGAAVDPPPTSAVPLVPIALPPPDTTTAAPTTAAPTPAAPTTAVPATAAPPASDALGSAMPTFPAPDGPVTYSTLPDGSPAPVVAIFDVDTITLAGNVPSQAAKDKLQNLALANSKTPAAVQNLLVIDPSVPIGIGVRVIELTSTRFPEGSSEILPDHAKEFDRIVAVMNALPSTTALVIGHADQLGTDEGNQRISEARASAVVTYLIRAGIAPSRLASRAVGATDLLTLANDDASLALNRRTEFVIYGLLLS